MGARPGRLTCVGLQSTTPGPPGFGLGALGAYGAPQGLPACGAPHAALRPAPACTWLVGSSHRPAAARRHCARARAPGGTAHASAPALQRMCSRWRRKGRLLRLQGARLPPRSSPCWAWTVLAGGPSDGGGLSPALGLEATSSRCPGPAGRDPQPWWHLKWLRAAC